MMTDRRKSRDLVVGCILACACGVPSLGLAHGQGATAPGASSSPVPLSSSQPSIREPKRIALVRRVYLGLLAGKADRTLFDARMNELLDPVSLASLEKSLAPYGVPSTISSTSEEIMPTGRVVDYTFAFAGARSLTIRFSFDSDGKIGNLLFPENFH